MKEISSQFKKEAIKALLSILFFILTYFTLISLAIILTVLGGYAGISLIALKPSFITLMIGIGLIGMGILVSFFLIKFIFKRHIVDTSNLVEITQIHEPVLFQFIDRLAIEINVGFPKKVYLSADVNACVFYDSSFWSMFFPVKKNLQIGLGLVNSVSRDELKAIIAHEFGHFSQRSMRIGSYVYHVNRIIYNLLYDNDSYGKLIEKWANSSGYFLFFAQAAVKIIQGMQWILRQVYNIVNANYMGLSREMEFHADYVAAKVVGSAPLTSSLLRLDLSNYAYESVISIYNQRENEQFRPDNFYPQHAYLMEFFASEFSLKSINGLPVVTHSVIKKFNQSKLIIKDQWASHPSTEDRVQKLEILSQHSDVSLEPAWSIFKHRDNIQKMLTDKLFHATKNGQTIDLRKFQQLHSHIISQYELPSIYKRFYDRRSLYHFDIDQAKDEMGNIIFNEIDDIYTSERNLSLYVLEGLSDDINTLVRITGNETGVKLFEYDGMKYSIKDAPGLLNQLQRQQGLLIEEHKRLDKEIFKFFYKRAKAKRMEEALLKKYYSFFSFSEENEKDSKIYIAMIHSLQFIHYETPYRKIEANMQVVKQHEQGFRKRLLSIMNDEKYLSQMQEPVKTALQKYLSQEWIYFSMQAYNDRSLSVLFNALEAFRQVCAEAIFSVKKDLLTFQVALLDEASR